MSFLSSSNFTMDEVNLLAQAAEAAYANKPLPEGWVAVTPSQLGLPSQYWDGPYFRYGTSEAIVLRHNNNYILSFRGTDSPPSDLFTNYGQLFVPASNSHSLVNQDYYPLLQALATYLGSVPVGQLYVTGHSLGAGAVNQLADVASTEFQARYSIAKFAAFASPIISNAHGILNIGFENDPVFKAISGRTTDQPSTADNLLWANDKYMDGDNGSLNPLHFSIYAHGISNYIYAMERLQSSIFYSQTSLDSPIIFDDAFGPISDQGESRENAGVLLLGEPLLNDRLTGRAGNDFIEGDSGNDRLQGGGGNDTIDGGANNDTVVFARALDHYTITFSGSQVIVSAIFEVPYVYEGTDTITNVENFEFAGTVYSREQLIALLAPAGNPTGDTGDQSITPSGSYSGGGTGTTSNGPDTIPGNISSTFVIGTSGQALTSAIETAGDKDYVRVYMVQGDTYRVIMQGAANHGYAALQDSFFRVRDGQGNVLASPSDQVGSDQLDFTAGYTGWHYISIGAGGPNYATLTGGYSLTATLINAPVANQAPVANTDELSVSYGQVITGNVLDNDSDADHNTLSVDFLSSFHTTLGGTVDLLPNGAFQYIAPSSSGTGSAQDSFSYTVRDGAGGSATGVVHLNLFQVAGGGLFTSGGDYVTVPTGGGTYHALSGDDVVFGSNFSDIIYGEDGNDFLHGLGGNDYLVGGNGDNGLIGGPGDDWLVPGAGRNQIWGDGISTDYGGFDTVDYSSASGAISVDMLQGTVTGGGANDLLTGIDNIIGSAFADLIRTYSIIPLAYGGGGNDTLVGYTGDDELHGGTGDDNLQGYIGNDHLYGDDGNDLITGGDGNDVLNGGVGDDQVFGENGNDYILASAGTDRLGGNDGIDTVDFSDATAGFTSLGVVPNWGISSLETIEIVIATPFDDDFSATSFQELHLGAGNDIVTASSITTVFGDQGNDRIFALDVGRVFGGSGDDRLVALSTTIELYGDDGNDHLSGSDGVDHKYFGGAGNDTLFGASGNELLSGDAGDDEISGGGGNDTISSGAGNDTVTGGAGSDRLVFDATAIADALAATPLFDRITDYNFAEGDKIDLSALLAAAYSLGNGQSVASMVRAIEDSSGGFSWLQIDTDGAANGASFVTIARLDGIHAGDNLSVIMDSSIPAGATIAVAGAPAIAGSVSINDVQVAEGNSGTKLITFTVTRTGGTAAFNVNFSTADSTATVADGDYIANSGTLNFGAGVNSQSIAITINGDIKNEPNQTFFVNLTGATNGAVISDGQGLATITNDDTNNAPQVNLPSGANVPATAGQTIAASSLFSASDLDGDTLTYFIYDATAGASSGHWVVNGTVIADQTVVALSASQLTQTTYVAGAAGSSDTISMMVHDGQTYSGNTSFTSTQIRVPGINHAPVVTANAANVAASAGQSIAASSLFNVSDSDSGDTLTYYLYDATAGANSGHWVVNGNVIADQTVVAISASQFAQTRYVAGSSGASDTVSLMVYDGQAYSGNTSFTRTNVNVPGVNHAPVVTANAANVAATAAQSIAASSLFSVSDSDVGDTLTYFLYDATPGANSGHWVVNGNTVADQTVVAISASQFAQARYVAGSSGASDTVSLMVYDGHTYSGNTSFTRTHVNVPGVNHAPVVTANAANVAATAAQSIAASSLFSVSDSDVGDTLTYFLYDATPGANSGHWVVNGNTVADQTVVAISASQFAQARYVAGSSGASDTVSLMVYDGHTYSGNTSFTQTHVNVAGANHAPVVTIPQANVPATPGQTIAASSLFSASDLDGDTLTYFLYDATPAASSGHWVVNGSTIAAQTVVALSAYDVAHTSFVAGASGSNDDLLVMVYDGHEYSGNTSFSHFHVLA